ncbi:hypothetical protein, partial [Burkholderia multivorans]|uniref:hypothetical protein n=1 Tax=Burkholderia multivorans TaxID=87883 RepID=UPI001C212DE8
VRPEYERNSPRMSSNSYVNLKIATCLVRYADDRLIDQRFPSGNGVADAFAGLPMCGIGGDGNEKGRSACADRPLKFLVGRE